MGERPAQQHTCYSQNAAAAAPPASGGGNVLILMWQEGPFSWAPRLCSCSHTWPCDSRPLLDASKNITNLHRFPGVSGGLICATLLALALALAPALALRHRLSLALAFAVRHRSSACSFSSSTAIQGKRQKKTKISGLGHTLTQKPQAWLGAHEHGQDPGENWRRIELFIGENEHLIDMVFIHSTLELK